MTKSTERENLPGQMEEDTKDNGKMENNMEEELILDPMDKKDKENGMREKESSGLTDKISRTIPLNI